MAITDTLGALFGRRSTTSQQRADIAPVGRPPRRSGRGEVRAPRVGRQSQRAPVTWSWDGYTEGVIAVKDPVSGVTTWDRLDLSRSPFGKMTPSRLLDVMADASPEVSKALWDFLRFSNPGWEVRAVKAHGSDVEVTAGTKFLQAFMLTLQEQHGSADVPINRLLAGAWTRGGFFAELVIGKDGRTAVDLATPDPGTVRFIQVDDKIRGRIWQLCQIQNGERVPLKSPLVRYVPIDPLPDSPYGRSPAHPALFTTIFLLGMLYDIKRVVNQQGYPRLDLTISLEQVLKAMPEEDKDDQEAIADWIEDVVGQISRAYGELEPDEAYVHTDMVQVGRPVGTVDAGSLGSLSQLIVVLERMSVRALKTMPLLMGITDGVSEANANRQWEIHVAGIKSIQHLAESLLDHLLTQALQAAGIAAVAEFRFAELRAAEMLRDEQVRALQIANAKAEQDAGWIDADEAALKVVGHKPTGKEKQPPAPFAPADKPADGEDQKPAPNEGDQKPADDTKDKPATGGKGGKEDGAEAPQKG